MEQPTSNSNHALKPFVAQPGSGRSYDMGRIRAIFIADRDETASRFSISEWWLEPHTRGPGVHAHPEDHVFYVIQGTLSLFAGGDWTEAVKGAYAIIPGDTPHDFENRTAERVGFISMNVPGGFEAKAPGIAEALSATDLRL